MSIDTVNDLPPRVQYIASASQTVFPYPFPIFQDADLVVEVNGAEQTLTTHYTVSGAGDDTGGDVTFTVGNEQDAGAVVTIYRETVIARDSDFQLNGPMFSTSVNDELDKLTVIAQEQRAATNRCLRIPMSAEVADADIALSPISNWFNKYMYFDADGKPEPAEVVTGTISQSVIGALLYPRTAAELSAGVTPSSYAYPPGHFQRYGADPTGTSDSTTAINNAIACSGVANFASRQFAFCDGGDFRIDGTITVDAYQCCYLRGGRLIRKSSGSASTAPVLHVKGTQAVFDGGGGSVWTENNSPDGLVVCGHLNRTTSDWNSLWWKFCNTWVYTKDFGGAAASPYPGAGDGIGVYVPSSQPQLGSTRNNYFGTIENVFVHNATTAFWLTDLANGHILHNCGFRGFYHSGFVLNGAYGNTIIPAFCEIAYKDSTIVVHLNTKLSPGAPHASSLESDRNTIHRLPVELGGTGHTGIRCEATCQYNNGSISFNATGTAIVDLDGANELDSDTEKLSNKSLSIDGLLTVDRTVGQVAALNSTHANGPFVGITRSGSSIGQLGCGAAGVGGGTNNDLELAAASGRALYLAAFGGGRIIFAGAGQYTFVAVPAYADNAAAAAGGVPVGGLFRIGGALQVRT